MPSRLLPFIDILRRKYPDTDSQQIYARIVCGEFSADGETIRDPGRKVAADVRIDENRKRFVSRGGEKLFYALQNWNLPVKNKIFIDAGCSTGGFTDCLLQSGAAAVHAVDVGYNQLDYSLRSDQRVIVHERTNIMDLLHVQPEPHAGVMDLSFRSAAGAAPHLLSLIKEKWIVVLIKPQFEYDAGNDPQFNGVLSDPERIIQTLKDVLWKLADQGAFVHKLLMSPVRGRKGNIEFLTLLTPGKPAEPAEVLIREVKPILSARIDH